jgi:hypothetical protein
MTKTQRFGVLLGVLLTLGIPALACAPEPESSKTASLADPSAVKRVLETYAEFMGEMSAMMSAGGRPTERSRALEARLSEEVKAAGPALLAVVRTGDYETANAAVFALSYSSEPEAAVAALLDGLPRLDGKLTNNIGIALTELSTKHPTLNVPMAPLVAALHSQEWNYQQKMAQTIEVLVRQHGIEDPDGALASALIPMLASQRVRVFEPARILLPIIALRALGNAPERWATWYAATYGRSIDLAAGVYELVQIVHLGIDQGREVYRVEERTYVTEPALIARLREDANETQRLGRKFAVVFRIPEGFPGNRIGPLLERILMETSAYTVTGSPESDEFVPFSIALQNLRTVIKTSTADRDKNSSSS